MTVRRPLVTVRGIWPPSNNKAQVIQTSWKSVANYYNLYIEIWIIFGQKTSSKNMVISIEQNQLILSKRLRRVTLDIIETIPWFYFANKNLLNIHYIHKRFGLILSSKNLNLSSLYKINTGSWQYTHFKNNSTLLYSLHPNSIQLNLTLLKSTQISSTQPDSTQLNSTQL